MPISETSAVERVARVLAGLEAKTDGGFDPSSSEQVEHSWKARLEDARAVLRTLREPSAAMVAAGNAETWTSMVHAALDELGSAPGAAAIDAASSDWGPTAAPTPDPALKSLATTDPTAQDPGNGAD